MLSSQNKLIATLGNRRFFWAICALFAIEALWIALSGRYPMAFDEDFHFGIIQIYAHHLSPFLAGQPSGANAYGAVARDPSYLFQYLMSFVLRLIRLFTNDQTVQVLLLRFLDIGLFGSSLPLFRRLLHRVGLSNAAVNVCLLAFILIPIVPLLAGQINYDNLFIPLVAASLLLAVKINDTLRCYKRIDVRRLLALSSALLLGSLVKFAFLPIAVTISGFLVVRFVQVLSARKILINLGFGWTLMLKWQRRLLLGLFVISAVLFGQRYGVNIVRYHTPVPDCSQVLTVQQCSQYGPWIRDYNYHIADIDGPRSPLKFGADWFYGMWLRTFFAVDGPHTSFQTRGPLLVPAIIGALLPAASLVAICTYARRIFKDNDAQILGLLTAVSAGYVIVLWLDDYRSFLHTGHPVAINGRYLLPVFLPILAIACLAFTELLRNRRQLKIIIAVGVIVGLAWGGGALTYIIRSNDQWYWPNQTVIDANHAVQNITKPIIPGSNQPTEFLDKQ